MKVGEQLIDIVFGQYRDFGFSFKYRNRNEGREENGNKKIDFDICIL